MRNEFLVSERLYRALLVLYPKEFRAAYGQQMCLAFRDACRVAYHQNGASGLLAFWLPTLLDLFRSALEERARRGEIVMLKAKLMVLAGPLTITVGVLWVVASMGDFAFQTGLLRDEVFLGLVFIPFFFSFIPMLLALIGMHLRFYYFTGVAGRVGLSLSVAGCGGVLISVLANMLWGGAASDVGQLSWMNYLTVGCVLSIRVGYILFGVDVLRYRLLPRWNLLPLLVGLTIVLSLPLEWFGVPALLPSKWANPFLHFVLTGVCWILFGITMMNQKQEPQLTAAI